MIFYPKSYEKMAEVREGEGREKLLSLSQEKKVQ